MSTADSIALLNVIAATIIGAAIIFATFRGPIIATRQSDERRMLSEKRAAKLWVFRQLMGHRYDITHQNFVGALNLIPIEFAESPDIIKAFDEFIEAFDPRHSERSDAGPFRSKVIVRLLQSMGRNLGYDLEQLDLKDQVYSPQGWTNVASQQEAIRKLLVDIADGKRAFPVLTMIPEWFVEDAEGGKFAIKVKQSK